MRPTFVILIPLLAWFVTSGTQESIAADPAKDLVVWPISRSSEPDTNLVVFPYGPRNIGKYNFHAGIDIYVKRGTPVGSIMSGRVLYTNQSTVLVQHSDQRKSAYLHLDSVKVLKGDSVQAGDIVGTVGDTNAKDVHLHLTYLVGPKQFTDEVESRNPLEILPHKPPAKPTVKFEGNSVTLTLDPGLMTVRRIDMVCVDGRPLSIDYQEIVKQGRKRRQEQTQSGIHIDVGRPRKIENSSRVFDLILKPADSKRALKQVVLKDINGLVLLDVENPAND